MVNMRKAFTLIELLTVIAIIGVLIAILLPAIHKIRESAKQTECENNMRQLGIGMHAFHDAYRTFPLDYNQDMSQAVPPVRLSAGSPATHSTFYVDLLPFIEEQNQVDTWDTDPQPVKSFLCPSRRTASVGARDDYGHGQHPHAFKNGGNEGIPWNYSGGYRWQNKLSILGGIYTKGVSLSLIDSRDGSSTTALLAHKGMEPKHYQSTSGSEYDFDRGWADLTNYWEHQRFPGYLGRDSNGLSAGITGSLPAGMTSNAHMLLTSPHPAAMPVLFADGSLQHIRYGLTTLMLGYMWSWNDAHTLDLETLEPITTNTTGGGSGTGGTGSTGGTSGDAGGATP